MARSRSGSASSGGALGVDKQHKANSVHHFNESGINRSKGYRPLSRSPSPYRRRPDRPPSPYRRRTNDRSPSPYRKRKASPVRESRPEKRQHHAVQVVESSRNGHVTQGRQTTVVDADYTPAPVEEQVPTEESREEKKRRWAAKRAAAEQAKSGSLLHQAVLTNASEVTTPNAASPAPYADSSMSPFPSPRMGDLDSVPASPDVMIIDKQGRDSGANSPAADSPSAADYDPMQDMLDDRDRAAKKNQSAELASDAYNETDPQVLSTLPAKKAATVKKPKKDVDMFASEDEDEDMEEAVEEDGEAKGTVLDEKLLDNWDDPEGYYKLISNELVNNGRYRMIRNLGRGVFANVAQAEDTKADIEDPSRKLVAVKMIRRNELMRKASQKEMDHLRNVNDADPQDKRHIIRLLGSFDHKGHLCIVFEHMSKNLRDLLKEETNGHGLALPAVRMYAKQMFSGLQHLQTCQVIHLDLKPDNVLVSADKKTIKLADFGTAVDKRDIIDRTVYLVSRFYRAPEIILGMDISYPVDIWAVGCTVYELWTGKILFTGRSNNQMVKAFMDCLGWPSEKLLRKARANNIFDHFEVGSTLKFISREVDQNNKVNTPIFSSGLANLEQPTIRVIEQQKKAGRDLKTRVHDAARGIASGGPTSTELNDLADLLGACLHMNIEKRVSPKEAMSHKFFGSKNLVPKPASSAVVKPPLMKRGTVRR
jgi:serine/threonine-protein kinase PRP4